MNGRARPADLQVGPGVFPTDVSDARSGAVAVLTAAASSRLHAYVVVSLLTGIRTEEARALAWDRTHLTWVGELPPHTEVWRSARVGGDTKTEKSRRTLTLPLLVVDVLKAHKGRQTADRLAAGPLWHDTGLVFTTTVGTGLMRRTYVASFGLS